jgi:hypothetical protein
MGSAEEMAAEEMESELNFSACAEQCAHRVTTFERGVRVARRGRYFLPDQPLHVIQRGNNREATFFREEDYMLYRDWL